MCHYHIKQYHKTSESLERQGKHYWYLTIISDNKGLQGDFYLLKIKEIKAQGKVS